MSGDRWLVHVEHGAYSDWCYTPLAIFDTEDEAREFVSRLFVRFDDDGWLAYSWHTTSDDDVTKPFEMQEDGSYSCGDTDYSDYGCTLFITRFKGGIGVMPSYVGVRA